YSGLKLNGRRAEVTVTNAGQREGAEAVLWFLTDEVGRITRPVKRLRHYEKVRLKPGESRPVRYEITDSDLGYPDERGRLVHEPGWHTLAVGGQTVRFLQP
ncbi:MAG: fibronectin type III-like domain-contianing protein, partial [Candidatus Eremiobacterota bacterium]